VLPKNFEKPSKVGDNENKNEITNKKYTKIELLSIFSNIKT